MCVSGEGKVGLHHLHSGAVYKGDCKLCLEGLEPVEAIYWGETGRSAYCRTLEHIAAIKNKDEKNAFSKHLTLHHPEEEGNTSAFQFSLVELHSKPLPRLTRESCYIHNNNVDIPMHNGISQQLVVWWSPGSWRSWRRRPEVAGEAAVPGGGVGHRNMPEAL